MIDIKVIVGLEAHDGTGKSTTAVEISKLFNGSVFFTNEQIKEKRSNIYRNKSMTHPEKMQAVEKTYEDEKLEFHQKMNTDFVVLDRTWYSHTVEENVMDVLDKESERTYPTNIVPDNVIQPNFVFQIIIPENERQKRVKERGEELTPADHRLNNDDIYRNMLEKERERVGCKTLRLRLRDPEVCALRVVKFF